MCMEPSPDLIFGRSALDTPADFGFNGGIGVDSVSGDVLGVKESTTMAMAV